MLLIIGNLQLWLLQLYLVIESVGILVIAQVSLPFRDVTLTHYLGTVIEIVVVWYPGSVVGDATDYAAVCWREVGLDLLGLRVAPLEGKAGGGVLVCWSWILGTLLTVRSLESYLYVDTIVIIIIILGWDIHGIILLIRTIDINAVGPIILMIVLRLRLQHRLHILLRE